ncbi:MAG: hypothetical protein HDQ87_07175 [Clostridia bacterium]|nr:hypothetical protein [Clostridia bacterium]
METIYTKFTDYRRARFRLMTSICEREDGRRVVIKKNAPGGHAEAHLERIMRNRSLLEQLYDGSPAVCPCRRTEGGLEFPFIEGTSCLEVMRRAADTGGMPAFLESLHSYVQLLEGPPENLMPFTYTDAFQVVFGYAGSIDGVPALGTANLDASPGNLIQDAAGMVTLIDYEWVFDFPVPRDFILYRHLRFLFAEQGFACFEGLTLGDLLRECGVRMDLAALDAMYDGFQRYVCVEPGSQLSCAEIFERHRKPAFSAEGSRFRRPPHFVFLDKGEGFNEQEKLIVRGEDGQCSLNVDVSGVCGIRFDPFEGRRTLTENLRFVTDRGTELPYEAPSPAQAGNRILLNEPANTVVTVPEDTKTLTISGSLLLMDEQTDFWLGQLLAAEGRAGELERTLVTERETRTAEDNARAAEQTEERRIREAEMASVAEQLEQQRAAQEANLSAVTARAQAAEQDAAQLRAALEAMQNSRSWRATAWLRRLRAALRRQ